MKIYSNIITRADVRDAVTKARANGADVYIDDSRTWQPRGYSYGTEIWLASVNGKRATAHGPITSGPRNHLPRAASWTDYGYVIAHLFNLDPHARIGFYDNEADFVAKVREFPRSGESLDFLNVLTNIAEYAA
jgi:hypothetical protein